MIHSALDVKLGDLHFLLRRAVLLEVLADLLILARYKIVQLLLPLLAPTGGSRQSLLLPLDRLHGDLAGVGGFCQIDMSLLNLLLLAEHLLLSRECLAFLHHFSLELVDLFIVIIELLLHLVRDCLIF